MTQLKIDDFYYDTRESTEEITHYTTGGYHPIILGDIFSAPDTSRKYRIMSKLGHGSYATVWLAQNIPSGVFVALKVTTADHKEEIEREAAVLEAAREIQPEPSNILSLLDHFIIHGPNGTHAVIVTDVAVPILPFLGSKHPSRWYKQAAYGIAQGLAHLHAAGIVHGDLHLGNIGLAIPQLAERNPYDFMVDLTLAQITPVLPASVINQTSSLPAYLIESCGTEQYMELIGNDPPRTKIIDFGSAHKPGIPPLDSHCALHICPPELAFARYVEKTGNFPPDPPADTWAFGASLYQLMTGSHLLRHSWAGMFGVLSDVPQHWKKSWEASPNYKPADPTPEIWWETCRAALRTNCEDEDDTDALLRLLKKVLALDPAKRMTAAQIVCDPWFRGISTDIDLPSFDISTRLSETPLLCT